jgi:hypothetical protein
LRRPATRALAIAAVIVAASGCGGAERAMPRCDGDERLGLVAQSVPEAAYLPCVEDLPAGWQATDVDVRDGRTLLTLRSDRAEAPVRVELLPACDPTGAVPLAPRDAGVRTQQLLDSISPSYQGTIYDVFPGGCITYRFDFERGPHLALMDELQQAVQLYPRRELRQALIDQSGVDIGP